jgi:hypothetical protein
MKKVAFIVDGIVSNVLMYEHINQQVEAELAGFASNPTIVEITDNPTVVPGYLWDGSNFSNPA